MFPALLAALPEAVGGLFGGLGEAVLPRLVAGVALVGHGRLRRQRLRAAQRLASARRSARAEQK